MRLINWMSKLLGSFFIGIAILLLFSLVFLGAIAEQIDQLPEIVDKTVETYYKEHESQVILVVTQSGELESIWDVCDQSEKSKEECEEELTKIYVREKIDEAKIEWTQQLQEAFSPFKKVTEFSSKILVAFIITLLIGIVLIFYGVKKEKIKLLRILGWRIGLVSVLPFVILLYLQKLDKNGISNFIATQLDGAPKILVSFISLFAYDFVTPIINKLLNVVIVLIVIGFGIWGLSYLIKLFQDKKN